MTASAATQPRARGFSAPDLAHVAVFDAVGHGLQASLLANLAVSCYRNTRRAGLDLATAAATIDQALDAMFGGERINVTEKRAVLHTACGPPRGRSWSSRATTSVGTAERKSSTYWALKQICMAPPA